MTMSEYEYQLHHDPAPAPAMDGVLLSDQLGALLQQESLYQVHHIPCCRSMHHVGRDRPELEDWRRKICQWSYRVIDHFRL